MSCMVALWGIVWFSKQKCIEFSLCTCFHGHHDSLVETDTTGLLFVSTRCTQQHHNKELNETTSEFMRLNLQCLPNRPTDVDQTIKT